MKKVCILVGIIILISVVLSSFLDDGSIDKDQIIRIHIKAHSNEYSDQQLKLEVRDAVIELISPWMKSARNIGQARKSLSDNLPKIKECAEKVLIDNNCKDNVEVVLDKREFPTRYYDNVKYEQGVYEALTVTIGEGKGDNWWCVAYPYMCYSVLDKTNRSTNNIVKQEKKSLFKIIRSWFRWTKDG
ncbi:MAG TPA: stage II sporulation protein R [Clostridia bacterium]|nr:stage II sporulation protein R [Clostridia bacterium]